MNKNKWQKQKNKTKRRCGPVDHHHRDDWEDKKRRQQRDSDDARSSPRAAKERKERERDTTILYTYKNHLYWFYISVISTHGAQFRRESWNQKSLFNLIPLYLPVEGTSKWYGYRRCSHLISRTTSGQCSNLRGRGIPSRHLALWPGHYLGVSSF